MFGLGSASSARKELHRHEISEVRGYPMWAVWWLAELRGVELEVCQFCIGIAYYLDTQGFRNATIRPATELVQDADGAPVMACSRHARSPWITRRIRAASVEDD